MGKHQQRRVQLVEAASKTGADRDVEPHVDGLVPRDQHPAHAVDELRHAGLERGPLAVHREDDLDSLIPQQVGKQVEQPRHGRLGTDDHQCGCRRTEGAPPGRFGSEGNAAPSSVIHARIVDSDNQDGTAVLMETA